MIEQTHASNRSSTPGAWPFDGYHRSLNLHGLLLNGNQGIYAFSRCPSNWGKVKVRENHRTGSGPVRSPVQLFVRTSVAMFELAFNHDQITPALYNACVARNSILDLTRA